MTLAIVENNGQSLHIHRMNTSYVADIKSGIGLWLAFLIFFTRVTDFHDAAATVQ